MFSSNDFSDLQEVEISGHGRQAKRISSRDENFNNQSSYSFSDDQKENTQLFENKPKGSFKDSKYVGSSSLSNMAMVAKNAFAKVTKETRISLKQNATKAYSSVDTLNNKAMIKKIQKFSSVIFCSQCYLKLTLFHKKFECHQCQLFYCTLFNYT